MKNQKFQRKKTVLCAYAKHVNGPGWSNSPLWFIYRDENLQLKEMCLQPEEQNVFLKSLYDIAEAVNDQLIYRCQEILDKQPQNN